MSLFRQVYTELLEVQNPLFAINGEEQDITSGPASTADIGFFGQYWNGSTLLYNGLFRDSSDGGTWKLFDTLEESPVVDTGSVNTAGVGFALANLNVMDLLVSGDLTVDGTTTTINTETLVVEDNVIIANGGPANQKEDGGFVFRRSGDNITNSDTPTEAGIDVDNTFTHTTTSFGAAGSTPALVGAVDDYYNNWYIKWGSATTTAALQDQVYQISDYVNSGNVFTTVETMAAVPVNGDTFDLFNRIFMGVIWDESEDSLSLFAFPREDLIGSLNPAATDGSAPSYTDLVANDIEVKNDLIVDNDATITGDLTVFGNLVTSFTYDAIFPINNAETGDDGGFVFQRSAANVVGSDPVKEALVEVGGAFVHTNTSFGGNGATPANGAIDDYYNGWVIQFDAATTTVALQGQIYEISDYVATNKVFTTSTTMAAVPVDGDEFNLYNRKYTGIIWDEDVDRLIMAAFPRESGILDLDSGAVSGNAYEYVDFTAFDISALGDLAVTGSATFSTNATITGDLSVGGTITGQIEIEDNILPVNITGASADGGFVVHRSAANVVASDTIKETGTVSSGTSTTVLDLASGSAGQGTTNYYVGWTIELTGGTVSGVSRITASDNATPTQITVSPAFGGTPVGDETYNLYNKTYIGMIYDESVDKVALYGFPRENNATIDPAAVDGNAAEYIDFIANDVETTTLTVTGASTLAAVTATNITMTGDLSIGGVINSPLLIDDNILAINAGPTNDKEDGGFVVARQLTGIVNDTPKQTGTASAGGTSTTITLQAANGHGTTLNYYRGWAISLGGDVTGDSFVLSSTAADPPVLTLETAASGSTTTSTTYDLFNKRYVGPIYDESADTWSLFGFPREDGESPITINDAGGNLADYIDFKANDITSEGAITTTGGLLKKTLTITSAVNIAITSSQFKENDIIYVNPTVNQIDFELPTVASLGLASGEASCCLIVNISPTDLDADIVPTGGDDIEGSALMRLKSKWIKMTLIASPAQGTSYIIE